MKLLTIAASIMLVTSVAFAEHHEGKKKSGHDKEHAHVSADKVDHAHDDAHHKKHDHKAHHPEHKDTKKSKKKASKKANKKANKK